jgi:hypothetical protein
MSTTNFVRRLSTAIVLGAEAVGALLIHDTQSLLVTAIFVIVAVGAVVWLLDTGLDKCVSHVDWVANWLGMRVGKKSRVHGWWYSMVIQEKEVIGHSVFRIRAGTEGFELDGWFRKLSNEKWSWWSGQGARFANNEALLYGYKGKEGELPDEGFGIYEFVEDAPPRRVAGNFYGKQLEEGSNYRAIDGERCPKRDVTRQFHKDVEERKRALERHYGLTAAQPAVSPPQADAG